jgi:predicted nucleic acid-binding protein
MPTGRRRERLAQWLAEELPLRFEEGILTINQQVAESWGVLLVRGQKIGLTLGSMDAFVAATAEVYGLTLVTRNVKDFRRLGLSLLDPWAPPLLTLMVLRSGSSRRRSPRTPALSADR